MRDLVAVALLWLILALVSFACFLWGILGGEMLGLDGLLLVLIALTLGGIFSLNLAWLVLKTPLKEALHETLGAVLKLRPRLPWRPRAAAATETDHSNPSAP